MSLNIFLILDPGGVARVPRERDEGRRDLHRARQEEDRDGHRRGVRPQEAGQDSLWLRILNRTLSTQMMISKQ